MSKVEYLRSYYPFDDDVMASLEEAVAKQTNTTWPEFVAKNNIPELKKVAPRHEKPIEVLDLQPDDYDQVCVYHMPMGCLLDANTMTHVITLAHASPERRVISVSNPGQPGRGSGKLAMIDLPKVWNGDLLPTVSGTLAYLQQERIRHVEHVGISYGADKAAASAQYAEVYDQWVPRSVMIESTSVHKKSLAGMALTFLSTSKHTDKYVEPIDVELFENAQEHKESEIGFVFGLARISNLAIGRALGRGGFEQRIDRAMELEQGMKIALGWGTKSEFAINSLVKAISDRLAVKHGHDKVQTLPVEGQSHAMNINPYLNAALILQGLKKTR